MGEDTQQVQQIPSTSGPLAAIQNTDNFPGSPSLVASLAPPPTSNVAPVSAPYSGFGPNALLGNKLSEALEKQPDMAANLSRPGGWARSILAGAHQVFLGDKSSESDSSIGGKIAGVANSALSGAASVGEIPRGAGPLYAMGKVIQQRQQAQAQAQAQAQERADRLKQQSFENNLKTADQVREDRKADDLHAMNTAQTVALYRSVSRADDEFQQTSAKDGKTLADMFAKHHDEVKDGVSLQDLRKGMTPDGIYDPDKTIAYHTGNETTKDDKGNDVLTPTFTLYQRNGRSGVVTPEAAALMKKYLPESEALPEGSTPDEGVADMLATRALQVSATANLINAQNRKEDLDEMSDKQIKQHAADLATVNPLIGAHASDPITALGNAAKQVDPKTKQATPVAQAATRLLQAMEDKTPGALETHRHNVEEENIARQKKADEDDSKKEFKGDSRLIGNPKAYLGSLKPDEQSVVVEAGTGRMPLQRLDYLAARNPDFLAAVANVFPDFDGSKVSSYVNTYKNYTSGKDANALNAGATAMLHLKRLYDNTTFWSRNPASEVAKQREADINQLATEIAKFNAQGVAHDQEVKDIKDSLRQHFYSLNRAAAITETSKLMNEKLNQYQQEWDNAAPSKYYQAPMPNISPESKVAFSYVTHGGKYVVTDPDGGEHTFPTSEAASNFQRTVDKAKYPANILQTSEQPIAGAK